MKSKTVTKNKTPKRKKTVLKPNIAQADFDRKLNQAIGWLKLGSVVTVELRHAGAWNFRGKEVAADVLTKFVDSLRPYAINLSKPSFGKNATSINLTGIGA